MNKHNNSIKYIMPYWSGATWAFDDKSVGLIAEPFVAGAPEIITRLVEQSNIEDAKSGFVLAFSHLDFPGHTLKLKWESEEAGGNWYTCEQYAMRGWLCPALFKYFPEAPLEIYAQAFSAIR